HHISQTDGQTTAERHLETEFFYFIQELRSTRPTCQFKHLTNDLLQLFLGKEFIDKSNFFRHRLVEQDTTGNSIDQFGFESTVFVTNFYTTFNVRVFRNFPFVYTKNYFFCAIENTSLAGYRHFRGARSAFCHIIKTQYHVL